MTPEDRTATFKSHMVMVRHVVSQVDDEAQAEFFYRELEQECAKLIPKFRKGNQLSQMLARNRLQKREPRVINSAPGPSPD